MTNAIDIVPAVCLTRSSIADDPALSLFQKILLVTDGSVTELLSIYTGEAIRAHKIEQRVDRGGAPDVLACSRDQRLLWRKVLLVDRHKAHVYAASTFLFDKLSGVAQRTLLHTDTPIGLLWKQEKSEMYREVVDVRVEQARSIALLLGVASDSPLLSRTSLLYQEGSPTGVITEKFACSSFKQ